ncbi:hypothetical protein LOAG_06901 [Loa loa]|uniref:Uncharacterized protein n=1 Tax=Loa loa TaxID=7209 RepID=A0A1S0TXR1_LOALO|nr:hypothetical protein LOAG_06901 [Loa loa]EFO21586.1 hypothetical protein LOAG_06901 [Loa loa]
MPNSVTALLWSRTDSDVRPNDHKRNPDNLCSRRNLHGMRKYARAVQSFHLTAPFLEVEQQEEQQSENDGKVLRLHVNALSSKIEKENLLKTAITITEIGKRKRNSSISGTH